MTVPALIVAGTHSGSGKTTVTLAILAALVRRGLKVQGFKVGPDFLDPGHQACVTRRTSRNLDTWLLDPAALAWTFGRASTGADLAVIEGVMGLFDGRGGIDESGSTADLARAWDLPVLLVVDARGLGRSIAPLVRGFATFDDSVRVAGTIANKVGSPRHFAEYLEPGLKGSVPGVARLGYLRRDESLAIPSRHLGLLSAREFSWDDRLVDRLAEAAEATLDLDRIVALATPPRLPADCGSMGKGSQPGRRVRVALARDPAFCFYYEDNLDLLRLSGAEVLEFSPLEDPEPPPGTDLVYLGGGYPEVFAERLEANVSMRATMRRFHARGGAILAECGGLMACSTAIRGLSGQSHRMWDLIPGTVVMQSKFAALGYVTVVSRIPTFLGPAGTRIRGHEFHYSRLEPRSALRYATCLEREGREPRPDAIQVGGLLASYAHAHWGSNPGMVSTLVNHL